LQNADDLPATFGDDEKLVRIALDRGERLTVAGVQLRPGVLAAAADRVIGKQRDDRFQIVRRGPAEDDRAGAHARTVAGNGHSDDHFL
jgi:hypothetical protein